MGSVIKLAFNTVFPLLAMMLIGVYIRARGYISKSTILQINKLCSRFFIPCLLFVNIYSANLRASFNLRLFLIELACAVSLFLAVFFIVPLFVKGRKRRYTVIASLYWSNCMMFAQPVLTSLRGEAGAQLGAVMIVAVAPLFSAGVVVATELFRNEERVRLPHLLKSVFSNPILWGSLLGAAVNLLGIELPTAIISPIKSVAGIAAPLALIALGAFFEKSMLSPRLMRAAALGCFIKLFVIPALVLSAGLALGIRGLPLLGLVIIFGSPSAVSTFSIADPAFAEPELSAIYVSGTSLLSVISYFVWIVFLSAVGLF